MDIGENTPVSALLMPQFGTISAQVSFGHKADMAKPEFHVRFFAGIKEKLEEVRGKRSLNREINERLKLSLEPDHAAQLAELFRVHLNRMDEEDRTRFVDLINQAVEIASRPPKSKRGRSQ